MPSFKTMDLKGKKRTSGKKEQKSISELQQSLANNVGQEENVEALSAVLSMLPKITEGDDNALPHIGCKPGIENDLLSKAPDLFLATGRSNEKGEVPGIITCCTRISNIKNGSQAGPTAFTSARGVYNDIVEHCDNYIKSHNPWTTTGRQRLAIVKALRWQAAQERKCIPQKQFSLDSIAFEEENENNPNLKLFLYNRVEESINDSLVLRGAMRSEDKESVITSLMSENDITREEATRLVENFRDISDMERMFGGIKGKAPVEVTYGHLQKLASQASFKREQVASSKAQKPGASKDSDKDKDPIVYDTLAYMKKAGIYQLDVDEKTVTAGKTARFLHYFLEHDNSKEAKARNAQRITSLFSKKEDKRKAEWEAMLSEWASVDLSIYDDRRPERIMRDFDKLIKPTWIGFVIKDDVRAAIREAGFDFGDEQTKNIIALADFYNHMFGYINGIAIAFGSEFSLFVDSDQMGDLRKHAHDGDEEEGEVSNEFDKKTVDYVFAQNLSEQGSAYAGDITPFAASPFAADMKAEEILYKVYKFKGNIKELQNIKLKKIF